MSHDAWVAEYAQHCDALQRFADDTVGELHTALAQRGIKVQFVTTRVKAATSLERKLARPDKTYAHLWDVTDLVGIRIATYFEHTIEEVARFIEDNYAVDFRHSTDKSRAIDVSSFGYKSLHYVCAAPQTARLPATFRFEIQLRTALQHAWAEVEHDLGYKASGKKSAVRRTRQFAIRAGKNLHVAIQDGDLIIHCVRDLDSAFRLRQRRRDGFTSCALRARAGISTAGAIYVSNIHCNGTRTGWQTHLRCALTMLRTRTTRAVRATHGCVRWVARHLTIGTHDAFNTRLRPINVADVRRTHALRARRARFRCINAGVEFRIRTVIIHRVFAVVRILVTTSARTDGEAQQQTA